ncbi:ketoacyl-ACP synthase III [Cryomorpha ignava]|uniref:Ketoacyl-ACP synthase III n=1 Tax=Cryomorpha ignava TaxID=101383 RepID=A0A7K3WNU4_9FLAO|nr:ketoacyl-ACP synthase III [Cryomorpha ignava]NEN23327.1 ketoacyl-ACP synthase III [Cryomorpha ignava]
MENRNAIIAGTGMYAPPKVVTNSYFNELLGEDVDTWLRNNVQIYERRWTGPDESTADLAEKAGLMALENAGVTAADLDLIIISTDTPEFVSPSTASVVQNRLGALNAGTFDINAACAGFVTALDMAAKYIKVDSQYKHILVIGAYNMSKFLNLKDKKTVTLFADGAGAAVLSAIETGNGGMLASVLESKGEYNEWMGIYAGGAKTPVSVKVLEEKTQLLQFVHKFPKELNPVTWSRMIKELCEKAGIDPDDIARFYITQININAIHETLDILGVKHDKAEYVMHYYGYTGSACIPMALHQSVENNAINRGDYLMFIGSGGGLAFAGALFKY